MTDLSLFGYDPLWLVAAKAVAVFVFLLLTVLFGVLIERKVVAWMQMRVGPDRVGPKGLLQSAADGVKMAFKEDIVPAIVDKPIFVLAPIISVVSAVLAFAVIPFGPEVSILGQRTALQLTDLHVGVLYILAVTSVGVYGIVLAGWASGSTYPLLGGLRSTAQVISYEISMALCFAAVFLLGGTMATSGIIAAQQPTWYVFLLLPSFLIYCISMVGETNRAPFDLPEAEGELVGGFHTEYSSLKFAMFMLAEYVNMATVSALATTMFLGGWRAPFPINLWEGANSGWWPLLWFTAKVWMFLFVFIWLRGTLPRLRYDQFMNLGWKLLIPTSLAWVMVVATARVLDLEGYPVRTPILVIGGLLLTGLLIGLFLRAGNARPSRRSSVPKTTYRPGTPHPGCPGCPGCPGDPRSSWDSRLPHYLNKPRPSPPPPACSNHWRVSRSPRSPCSRNPIPSSIPRRRFPPHPDTTAAISSIVIPTAWRNASAANSVPGPAPPTPSMSRAPTTRTRSASRPVNATGGCIRSTICAVSAADCASKPARPGH